MKTVDIILEKIKREGAITAKKLSEDLDMTSMGARQHLQSLEDNSLVEHFDVKVKVGRPTRHWSLTDKGHAQFEDKHGDLTVQFIDAIGTIFGEEGIRKVAAERESATLKKYSTQISQASSLKEKLNQLVKLREYDGYMAELIETEEGFLLVENHCPICQAAQSCPTLCQSELNVFRSLLGSNVFVERTEHIIKKERRCVYLIKSKA